MHKSHYQILKVLLDTNNTNQLNSATIADIQSSLEKSGHPIDCDNLVYKKIKTLVSDGYICTGLKDNRKHKYYITQKGISTLKAIEGGE